MDGRSWWIWVYRCLLVSSFVKISAHAQTYIVGFCTRFFFFMDPYAGSVKKTRQRHFHLLQSLSLMKHPLQIRGSVINGITTQMWTSPKTCWQKQSSTQICLPDWINLIKCEKLHYIVHRYGFALDAYNSVLLAF